MLDRLVASRPETRRQGTVGSAALAVLLHGGVITAAVLATWPAPPSPLPVLLPDGAPYYLPTRANPPGGPRPSPAGPWSGGPMPDVGPIAVPEPVIGPLPVLPGPAEGWSQPRGGGAPGSPLFGLGDDAAGAPEGAVFSLLAVDEAPALLTHPALEYPGLLRTAGVEGTVVFEVVIDSAGRPEPETLRVVASSHPGFVAAAARVVLGSRFRPGRARGRPVRVLIRQPIAFRLSR